MSGHYFKISIQIKKEDDVYYAFCAELAGCHSQGDSYEEAKENIQEAVDLYLSSLTEHEAIDYLGKTQAIPEAKNSSEIQLRLNPPQAEKLLLKAGFKLAGSKDNHHIFAKEMQRFVLPLHSHKVLSRQIAQEILDLVGGQL